MAERRGVDYEQVGSDYMEKRQLKSGAAGWVLLAGLGVAYVISGDFAGWNFGLAEGGWGGLLIATVLMGTMYTCMVFALAELSSTISTAGGGYGFGAPRARALGRLPHRHRDPHRVRDRPRGDRRCSSAATSSRWTSSASPPAGRSTSPFYAIFVGVHLFGVGEALKVTFAITAIAVVALLVFVVAMIPEFVDLEPDGHRAGRLGRLERLPAVRHRGHLGGVPVRDLVLPRDRGRAARRRGDARSQARHAARADRRHDDPARLRRR